MKSSSLYQAAYKKRKFSALVGGICRVCQAVELTETSQSQVYPGICKACTNPWFRETNRRSVAKRLSAAVGSRCKACSVTVLTEDNQAKSAPGTCKPCSNAKAALKNKLGRKEILTRALGATCRACEETVLTSQTQSRSLLGTCKTCATAYAKAKRLEKTADALSGTSACSSCSVTLNAKNVSLSVPSLCKNCHNTKHRTYAQKLIMSYRDQACSECKNVLLDPTTQSQANPRMCRSCYTKSTHGSFDSRIGTPCVKCSIALTQENQSKAHLGKCKACRNAELICSLCGNKGGIYKGKICSTCRKKVL